MSTREPRRVVEARLDADDVERVRSGLRHAAARLEGQGVATPALEGKLLRPMVALGLVAPERRGGLDGGFWAGALAVQMVHEASLLHDDIVEGAAERRGRPSLASSAGVAAALLTGDRLLTGAYRAASASGSSRFLECFIEAVERTVAGEATQNELAGRELDRARYEAVVAAKSGALFGAAAVLGVEAGGGSVEEREAVGRALGTLYQMVDDLLDCCPRASTGKPPLQDHRQGKWTWVLEGLPDGAWRDEETLLSALFGRRGGPAHMETALEALRARAAGVVERAAVLAPGDGIIPRVVEAWLAAAARGVDEEVGERSPTATLEVV